jgi:hypothetical protein
MKTFIRKSLTPPGPISSLPDNMIDDAKALYAKIGKYAVLESHFLVRVPIDSVEYQMILEYESRYPEYFENKHYFHLIEKEFTELECNDAQFLILRVGNLTYPVEDGNLEFCCTKRCYMHGYKYSVPYRIEERSFGKKHLGNMTDGGFVVSLELKTELEKHNLSNLQFIPTYMEKQDKIVGYRLETKHLLPNLMYFDPTMVWKKCQTSGIPVYTSEIKKQLEITQSVVHTMNDFNATQELITEMGIRYYIISQNMYRILKQFTIRSFKCEPIKIID